MRRVRSASVPALSQHFLRSARLCSQLADAAEVTAADHVLDLGAGRGAITDALVGRAGAVTAVERDAGLAAHLHARLEGRGVRVVEGDMLTMALPRTPFKVVANLPFHVTTAVCRRLLDNVGLPLVSAVLVTEWGFACGQSDVLRPSREAIGWAPWWEVTLVRRLSRSVFEPAPSVDAGVLLVRRRERPLLAAAHARDFRAVLRRAFAQGGAPLKDQFRGRMGAHRAARLAGEMGLASNARPGQLDAWQWVAVYREMAGVGR